MSEATGSRVPERILLTVMQTGVNAITSDTDLLDEILGEVLDVTELAKVKTLWASNPPSVIQGYAREDSPFPVYALTLGNDQIQQDYIGLGEQAFIDDALPTLGSQVGDFTRRRRNTGAFNVWVWASHPDIVAYWYRVLRRVFNAGIPTLIANGLDDPVLTGTELMPDPNLTPENLFNRRLTITVEYNEVWSVSDTLAIAINGAAEPFVTEPSQIDARRKDSDPFPGKITPVDSIE